MGSAGSGTFGTFFSAPPPGYPTSQRVVFRDLSGCVPGANPYLHQGMPNLFGLPVHALSEAAQVRTPFVVPVAATHARSAPATRVDKNGTGSVVRDQRLADYEARLRLEESPLPIPTAGPMASTLRDPGHEHVAQLGADGIDEPPLVGGSASPWACHKERAHQLTVVAILTRTPYVVMRDMSLVMTRPPDDDN